MSARPTIFALSSAPGRAGVAVFRISGPKVGAVLDALCKRRPPPRRATVATVHDPASGDTIDRGLIIWFPGPQSFTGEDSCELQLHGGRAIAHRLLTVLAAISGCRLAEPGEFAQRAFYAGKIDLTEAEGLADLIDAETEAQRRQAVLQASGATSALYDRWRTTLIEAQALMEAAIDFSDEADVSDGAVTQARAVAQTLHVELCAHLADGRRGEILRNGFRVVLAGPVNAGKSSLLNWLAKRDAAIVSAEPGTTRDIIDVRLDLGGFPVIVSDTAGLRDGGGAIEQEGMRRSRAEIDIADLVLWLVPADAPGTASNTIPLHAWTITTKIDLAQGSAVGLATDTGRAISTETGAGLAAFVDHLTRYVADRLDAAEEPVITQARHRDLVQAAVAAVEAFLNGAPDETELRAEDLRQAASAIGRITGRVDVEDILDQVFGRFCIGK